MRITREKIPKYLLVISLIGVSLIIFIENFIFSSSFTILSLRGVDEVAFQTSLHKYHGYAGKALLSMNDFGYGWIYWFSMYLLTYPAHLLFESTGVSWLLIILPRMYSLLLCIMCSVLCYKIISIYTKNEWIKMAIVFMMPLFPTGCEWAGRFSTVPQVAFFSMLSIYLVVKNETLDRKKLRYSLLVFAMAMSTKVSAVVTVPLLVLLILTRYKWKFNWANFKLWIQESLLAVLVMIVFMCPIIVFAPLYPQEAKGSFNVLLNYMVNNQETADIIYNFKNSISFFNFKSVAILLNICLLALIMQGIVELKRDKEKIIYWDYVFLPIGYYIGILYLCATISSGIVYIFMYATSISFILPFGILLFDKISLWKKVGSVCIGLVAVLCCLGQILNIKNAIQTEAAYNMFSYYQSSMESSDKAESLLNMEKVVEELEVSEINYYVDYGSMSNFYNIMEHDNIGYAQTIWDDLGNCNYEEMNLIVLSKSSIGFYDDERFEATINGMELQQQDQLKEDRIIRQELVQNGRFLDADWAIVYEDDNAYIFKKIDSESDKEE